MGSPSPDHLLYYTQPGPLTTLPNSPVTAALLANLPADLPGLVQAVQNNLLHIFWAGAYGVTLSDERKAEVQIRTAAAMLDAIYAADHAPLTTPRTPDAKLVGNCRDFTVLTVALLRHTGIPARARCGFGTYFLPDHYEDHWVAEYWNADQDRWIMVDAQLDALQRENLDLVTFDPLDVPRGGPRTSGFVTGPHAWELVRKHGEDPATFGIFDMYGTGFIVGDFLRDVASLNKIELLPWDIWGIMKPDDEFTPEDFAFLDHVAALVEGGAEVEVRALYQADERLRVPPVIGSWIGGAMQSITLADEPGYVA